MPAGFGDSSSGECGERAEVLVLVGFQAERAGKSIDYLGAGPGFLAAFEPDVVVVADAGQGGEFLAA